MRKIVFIILIFSLCGFGCMDKKNYSKGVYMLLDTSGTYTKQLNQAKIIVNHFLKKLNSGDSFTIARIDSGSFSEKDIIAQVTFANRPSVANQQKLKFKKTVEAFISKVKGSPHTDIKGGILQAIDYLNETEAEYKYILIFSDLEEDLPKGHVRNLNKDMTGYNVVALNVTKLGSDQIDPEKYFERQKAWGKSINDVGGKWKKINNLKHLDKIIEN